MAGYGPAFRNERQIDHVFGGFEPEAASPIVISSLDGPPSPHTHAASDRRAVEPIRFADSPSAGQAPLFPEGRRLSELRGRLTKQIDHLRPGAAVRRPSSALSRTSSYTAGTGGEGGGVGGDVRGGREAAARGARAAAYVSASAAAAASGRRRPSRRGGLAAPYNPFSVSSAGRAPPLAKPPRMARRLGKRNPFPLGSEESNAFLRAVVADERRAVRKWGRSALDAMPARTLAPKQHTTPGAVGRRDQRRVAAPPPAHSAGPSFVQVPLDDPRVQRYHLGATQQGRSPARHASMGVGDVAKGTARFRATGGGGGGPPGGGVATAASRVSDTSTGGVAAASPSAASLGSGGSSLTRSQSLRSLRSAQGSRRPAPLLRGGSGRPRTGASPLRAGDGGAVDAEAAPSWSHGGAGWRGLGGTFTPDSSSEAGSRNPTPGVGYPAGWQEQRQWGATAAAEKFAELLASLECDRIELGMGGPAVAGVAADATYTFGVMPAAPPEVRYGADAAGAEGPRRHSSANAGGAQRHASLSLRQRAVNDSPIRVGVDLGAGIGSARLKTPPPAKEGSTGARSIGGGPHAAAGADTKLGRRQPMSEGDARDATLQVGGVAPPVAALASPPARPGSAPASPKRRTAVSRRHGGAGNASPANVRPGSSGGLRGSGKRAAAGVRRGTTPVKLGGTAMRSAQRAVAGSGSGVAPLKLPIASQDGVSAWGNADSAREAHGPQQGVA